MRAGWYPRSPADAVRERVGGGADTGLALLHTAGSPWSMIAVMKTTAVLQSALGKLEFGLASCQQLRFLRYFGGVHCSISQFKIFSLLLF